MNSKNIKLTIFTTAALLTTTSLSTIAKAENLAHTQQLLSTKQCQGCDLTRVGLIMADLVGANLAGADLSRANLSRANLTGADLSGANLSGASLNGANLAGANLAGANLFSTDLREAFLVNAQLYGVNLSNAYIQGTIGIPDYAGTPEDFYAWGVVEAKRGNYKTAIEYYDKTLSIKPDFAPAFLARGMARFRLGEEVAATQDGTIASELFKEQGNIPGYQASQSLVKGIEIAQNSATSKGGSNLGNALASVGSILLRFLSPF